MEKSPSFSQKENKIVIFSKESFSFESLFTQILMREHNFLQHNFEHNFGNYYFF